ncbi:MAG: hypothetical protein IKW15_05705 [Bacteroidales bacterium]|nr:hypothetical protein [Bacteroidales bacterium]
MKKLFLFSLMLLVSMAVQAQDMPYSKYLGYNKKEFKENKFKFDDYTNTWSLRKSNGLRVAVNVLAIIADGHEDMRPGKDDYTVLVQLGKNGEASSVKVVFYNDETYHKLLTYVKDNGKAFLETSSGNLVKHQANCNDYAVELNMKKHNVSRISSRTIDYKTVKNVDESYNEYSYVISTSVEPWSEYMEEQVAKQAKRDAKGKKKQKVEDLM